MNAIKNLTQAYKAQAITKDTHSLQDFHLKNATAGVARMDVVSVESKYVAKFDRRDQTEGEGAGNLGYKTRFTLANGETVGTFSNGARRFFEFFAGLMGYQEEMNFLKIDIAGNLLVDITIQQLDAKRKTYEFTMVEEGSTVEGLQEYAPTASNLLLGNGSFVDTETGEVNDTPATEAPAAAEADTASKPKK